MNTGNTRNTVSADQDSVSWAVGVKRHLRSGVVPIGAQAKSRKSVTHTHTRARTHTQTQTTVDKKQVVASLGNILPQVNVEMKVIKTKATPPSGLDIHTHCTCQTQPGSSFTSPYLCHCYIVQLCWRSRLDCCGLAS